MLDLLLVLMYQKVYQVHRYLPLFNILSETSLLLIQYIVFKYEKKNVQQTINILRKKKTC
jgi:hypothetical protein